VAALRAGNEPAFRALVARHHAAMVSVAMQFVPSRAVAEEVAQDTWLAVLRGLDRFEGRSSLRTWIFRILGNRARSRGASEHRSVPTDLLDDTGPAVPSSRFRPDGDQWPGHWADPPRRLSELPEERLVERETAAVVASAIDGLVGSQRQVIVLRDVEGWSSTEVCDALGLSEGNQRVLLHRARSKVRAALERHLGGS
jgi:RNA polymerase sigma-70 factor (ECF subfamily)